MARLPCDRIVEIVVTIVIAIATVANVCVAIAQWKALDRQNSLQAVAHVKVANFAIWRESKPHDIPILMKGEKIKGVTFALNYGGQTVEIKSVVLSAYWGVRLPMWRPYYDMPPTTIIKDGVLVNKLDPGEFGDIYFETTVPIDYSPDQQLFISGFVQYVDTFGTVRATLFARRYDPAKRDFVSATTDPDYEREN